MWDLRNLSLYPGDAIEFWAQTWDNDAVTGPKVSQSPVRRAQFPTSAEIFAEAEAEDRSLESGMKSMQEKQQALRQETESLERKLQRGKAPGQEEQSRIDRLSHEQKTLMSAVDSLSSVIKERYETALSDDFYRGQVMQKMQEIRERMEALDRNSLREMLSQMPRPPQQFDMKQFRQQLERMAHEQQDILARMEQALEFLKKLQAEGRLQQLAGQFSELSRLQDSLNSSSIKGKSGKNLSEKQKQAGEDLGGLLQKMQSLSSDTALNAASRDALSSIQEMLEQGQVQEQMARAADALSRQQAAQAQLGQSRAGALLKQASEQLLALAAGMKQDALKKIMERLALLAGQLLAVSFAQEELLSDICTDSEIKQKIVTGELHQALSLLIELGSMANYLEPVVMKRLGKAIEYSKKAIAAPGDAQNTGIIKSRETALEEINAVVIRLRDQLDQMSQSMMSGGASLEQMLQSMFSMSAEQIALNQLVRGLLADALREGMSDRVRRGRLQAAAAQRSLMERYQEAREELNRRPVWSGEASDVHADMQEVIRELESGQLGPETLNKQERILSRMLDGTLSAARKDYSKQRKAETALAPVQRSGPSVLSRNELERSVFSATLNLAAYPKEYRELIRSYLRSVRTK
jgi:hypothetical protein